MKRIVIPAALLLGFSIIAAAPAHAEESSEHSWHFAYQKVLTAYSRMQGFEAGNSEEDTGARWDLCDVDNDGTPELFISPGSDPGMGVMIYTCLAGEPLLLQSGSQQTFGSEGLVAVNTDEHLIGSFRTAEDAVQRTFFKFENSRLTQTDSFLTNIESSERTGRKKTVFQYNNLDVTRQSYDAAYEPYGTIVWREDVGRKYSFIDRSPLAGVKQSIMAQDPPNMKSALFWGSTAGAFVALCSAIASILWRAD